jgi:hypothetical protein
VVFNSTRDTVGYYLLDRYRLFGKPRGEIVRKLFCEADAPLQNEGRELLIEEKEGVTVYELKNLLVA